MSKSPLKKFGPQSPFRELSDIDFIIGLPKSFHDSHRFFILIASFTVIALELPIFSNTLLAGNIAPWQESRQLKSKARSFKRLGFKKHEINTDKLWRNFREQYFQPA